MKLGETTALHKIHPYYSDWYAENRERLLLVKKKYNLEYTKRPEVIARAKLKNATSEARKKRKEYKKTQAGKITEKRYQDTHKDKTKIRSIRHRLKRYGLTLESTQRLLDLQLGLCKICSKDISKKFHIDHSHATGKVRGLLCNNCNMGLGLFKDDILSLEKAIMYLQKNV